MHELQLSGINLLFLSFNSILSNIFELHVIYLFIFSFSFRNVVLRYLLLTRFSLFSVLAFYFCVILNYIIDNLTMFFNVIKTKTSHFKYFPSSRGEDASGLVKSELMTGQTPAKYYIFYQIFTLTYFTICTRIYIYNNI